MGEKRRGMERRRCTQMYKRLKVGSRYLLQQLLYTYCLSFVNKPDDIYPTV